MKTNETNEQGLTKCIYVKATYVKMDGTRAEKTFDSREKAEAAFAKIAGQYPDHDLRLQFSELAEYRDLRMPAPLTWKDKASHRGQEAYTNRIRRNAF